MSSNITLREAVGPTTLATAVVAGMGLLIGMPLLLGDKKKKGSQVILITGASSGIGKATALKLISEGHVVYGAARRVDAMKEIEDAGGHIIAMDVCNQSQIDAGVQRILKEQGGRIDALINNAGFPVQGPIEVIPLDLARRQFEVNLFGLAAITKAVLPTMRAQKSGTIINVSSGAGKFQAPFGAWYHASKHAVEGWSDCCRLDLKGFGIDVVIVEPGMIKTELGDHAIASLNETCKGYPDYEAIVGKFVKNAESFANQGSDVSVIVNVMSQAINAKHPKRRYMAGASIREMLFVRNWFGDSVMDNLLLQMLK